MAHDIDVAQITERIRDSLRVRPGSLLDSATPFDETARPMPDARITDSELRNVLERLTASRTPFSLETEPFVQSSTSLCWSPIAAAEKESSATDDLTSLHDDHDVFATPLTSHRRVLGRLVLLAKTIVRGLLTPILKRQSAYNAANARLISQLTEELAQARTEVRTLGHAVQQCCDALTADVKALGDVTHSRDEFLRVEARRLDLDLDLLSDTVRVLDGRLVQIRLQAGAEQREAFEPVIQRLQVQEEEAVIRGRAIETMNRRFARMQTDDLPALGADLIALRQQMQHEEETVRNALAAMAEQTRNSLEQTQLNMAERQRQALQIVRARLAGTEQTVRELRHVTTDDNSQPTQQRVQPPGSPEHSLDSEFDWLAFHDQYRGSESEIQERQRGYVRYFSSQSDVLDIGCGRGEFLQLLRHAGIAAKGVDRNLETVLLCRDKNLDVVQTDALTYLADQADNSLGGIFGAQVIEHLEPATIVRLVTLCHRKLRPGGTLLLETVNPKCLSVFARSFYMDLSHRWPCHPEPMRFLLSTSGFTNIECVFSSPIDPAVRLPHAGDIGLTGRETDRFDRSVDFLNDLLVGCQDYAVIGRKALESRDDAN